MRRKSSYNRKTRETEIAVEIDFDTPGLIQINTNIPFLDHLLHAMAFHGMFSLKAMAKGDIDIDPHHVVEDTGLVLGEVLNKLSSDSKINVKRFGHAVIPMDESLSEVTIDICGRPTMILKADFPQNRVGNFDMSLIREFLTALANRARISLHANIHYGENSHHMTEAMFKALGKAIKQAYAPGKDLLSTKGIII